MTQERDRIARGAARWAFALGSVLLLAAPGAAQTPGSVQDYRLPPAGTAAAPVQGPVDSEIPVARPTTAGTPAVRPPTARPAAATPSPEPARTRSPAPAPSARPGPRASEAPQQATREREPEPSPPAAPERPRPDPTPVAPPAAESSVSALPPLPQATASRADSQDDAEGGLPWGWLGLAGAMLLAAGGLLVWRRRPRHVPDEVAQEVPAGTTAGPEPSAPATLTPAARLPSARPAAPPPAPPPPALLPDDGPLGVGFEAQALTCSLVFANLSYRLVLTNRTPDAIGPLSIAGDIIAAHGSLPARDQLSLDLAAAETRHAVAALAPGESAVLAGQLRMPMAAIRPIQQGGAALFVPLARFHVEGTDGALAATRIFVVGEAGDRPDAALRPFALSRFPGVVRDLAQREVTASA